ncbi:MAG: hypothetical protein CM1200mP1_11500 [Candidatus Neomarinimicrobiota bacterium]|nr:MAG: hypothetical protein CM1200mP1_11500 [Candidatus Neomarinimicrobiota bacterium]
MQDQLFSKDLPRLANSLDTSFKGVVMKGRQNYICKTRLDWIIASAEKILNEDEVMYLIPLMVWLEHTQTGDMDECLVYKWFYFSNNGINTE